MLDASAAPRLRSRLTAAAGSRADTSAGRAPTWHGRAGLAREDLAGGARARALLGRARVGGLLGRHVARAADELHEHRQRALPAHHCAPRRPSAAQLAPGAAMQAASPAAGRAPSEAPSAAQVKLPAQPDGERAVGGGRAARRAGGRACLHGGRRRLEELAALRRDDLGQVLHKVAEARARPGRLRARELRRGQQRDQRDLRARGGPGSARARRGRRDRGWAGIARPRLRSAAQARAPPPRSCPADPRCAVQGLQGGG